MKGVVLTFMLLTIRVAVSDSDNASPKELLVDDYLGAVAECNVAGYGIVQFLVGNVDAYRPETFKGASAQLGPYVKNFRVALASFETVIPVKPELQPLHRSLMKQYQALGRWCDDLQRSLDLGDRPALLRNVADLGGLLRDIHTTCSLIDRNAKGPSA